MKRQYFGYVRVSTVRQGERGSSLIEQKSAIEAYAARQGLAISAWFEEMETAAKQGRRMFSRMLSQLQAGKADGLIIHKIDRSARNLRDWANLADLIDRGIDVRFVTDNFDMLSRGGRLSADIQAVVAADYIRNLRDEVKKGMYGRLKQGLYPWSAPTGYLNNGKGGKLKTIDPVKGPLVRYMFERYASSLIGFHALREEMHAKGLSTTAGTPLSLKALSCILNNPFYMGVMRVRATGETFPGAHEPLISKALFERVQGILRGKTVPRAKKHRFLFRKMIRCENCGRRTLTGEWQKGRAYYRCHGRTCQGVAWTGEELEAIALSHVERVRLPGTRGRGDEGETMPSASGDFGDFRDFLADAYADDEQEAERYRASLTLRLQNIDGRLNRLTDLLVDGAMDRDAYNARREQLVMNRAGVSEELANANGASPFRRICEEFERKNTALLQYETLVGDEKRELIDIVCSNFSVSSESSTFTLRTPYKEISEMEETDGCDHDRGEVRIKRIVEILREVAYQTPQDSPALPDLPELPELPKREPHLGWKNIDRINSQRTAEKDRRELREEHG